MKVCLASLCLFLMSLELYIRIAHPQATETQLLLEYWRLHCVAVVGALIGTKVFST